MPTYKGCGLSETSSSMANADLPTISIPSLAGSLLVACVLNWGLLGILLVQIYLYYAAFPEDRRFLKALVYGVVSLELVQTIIITQNIFTTFVSGFGSLEALDSIHTYWFTIPVSGGIAGFIDQVFFAYRINKIADGARAIPIFILAVTSGCASLIAAQQFHSAGSFSALNNNTLTSVGVWNGIGSLCDVIIAVFMPYFLLRAGTGLSPTHDLITNVLRLSIEAGALTALVAIAHLIFYLTRSDTSLLFVVFGVIISKVYANTVLVLLNHRMKISGGRAERSAASSENPLEISYPSRICVDNDRMTIRLDDLPRIIRTTSSHTSQTPKPQSPIEFRAASSQDLESSKSGV
ncbi:hypothetical protein BDQ17DRAFT_765718 [Cyathus striatus]|nr:hypothetical protein BDQ17DRAFT_765718 [Cyathus striatus]